MKVKDLRFPKLDPKDLLRALTCKDLKKAEWLGRDALSMGRDQGILKPCCSNLLGVITLHKILYVFQIQISHLTLSFDGGPHRFLIDTSGQWNSFLQESIQLLSNRNFFVPPFWQEPGPMKKHCEICATCGSILVDISSVMHSKTSTSKHWQSNRIHLMCPWYYKKVRKVPHTSRTFQSCILHPASSCAIMRSLRSSKLVEETPEHPSTHEHLFEIRVNTEGFSEIAYVVWTFWKGIKS